MASSPSSLPGASPSSSASSSSSSVTANDPHATKILWSSISRNGTILAEAGDDPFDGAVSQTAHGILSKKPTPGWEFFTLKNGDGWFGRKSGGKASTTTTTDHQRTPKLKGIKFHVYEHTTEDGWDSSSSSNALSPSHKDKNEPLIWVFAAVYNPEATTWESTNNATQLSDVKSFLEKMVGLTAVPRSGDPTWRTGGTLACQATFASILLQRMQEVTYLGKMARLTESLEGATELMQSNITAIMEREEQLHSMQEKSSQLNDMAAVFKKKTSSVRRRMMMQNAKHGIILGTAITAGVAVCVVPPLVAIL